MQISVINYNINFTGNSNIDTMYHQQVTVIVKIILKENVLTTES